MSGSAISVVDEAFSVLVCRPSPLAFDTRGLPELNLGEGMVDLGELRRLLVARAVPARAVDVVWRQLCLSARSWGPEWTVAAAGMAVPGLRALAGRLAVGRAHLSADIDSEILAGFLTALRGMDLDGPRLWWRLLWAAWRAGHLAAQERDVLELPLDLPGSSGSSPRPPYGHPDLVLGRAVAVGVLEVEEAELIGETRLGGVLIESLAGPGDSAGALRMRRLRAERRLVRALHCGDLGDVIGVKPARDRAAQARLDGLNEREA